jgi:Polyketide cyclase / dehydrase and lipid transport
MASIRKEIVVEADPELVWDAVRDFGALHLRLAPGFVTDCRLDGTDRRIEPFVSPRLVHARNRCLMTPETPVPCTRRTLAWQSTAVLGARRG